MRILAAEHCRYGTRSLSGYGNAYLFVVTFFAIFLSSNDPAGHVNEVSIFKRITWCDSHKSRFADKAMPLTQLVVSEVNTDSKQNKTYQKRPGSRNVGGRAVQVVAEEIAESTIDACI